MPTDITTPVKEYIPRSDYDHPWKDALSLYFRDFLEFCLPHIAKEIDWTKKYESLDKELNAITREAAVTNQIADKLIKIWMKNDKESFILCHIEVDGKPKRELPIRMMIYRYRIHDLYRLPTISIAILIDDDPNWRIDCYRDKFFDTHLEIRYIAIKLLDYQKRRDELEAINNRFAIVILAQLTVIETRDDPKARLHAKTHLTRLLYKKGFSRQDIIQLYLLIDWLITLPEPLVIKYNQAIKQFEEEQHVPYITTAERIGIQQGFQQGLKTGIQRGLHEGESTVLILLLQHRFHHIPSHFLECIQQADANTLVLWAKRAFDAISLEEVFI